MSIRSESLPYRGRLSYPLENLLRKNGMSAQLIVEDNKYKLLVQGHDSPTLSYDLSEQQFRALGEGGTNYANKKAYNTFNSIVAKDFDLPSSYVAARNVNSRVVMGLHGYRVETGAYGRPYPIRPNMFGPTFLGWSPRLQPGMHLRRMAGIPMVAEHADGRLRPGELKSGSYGYYYKGSTDPAQQAADPLKEWQTYFPPVETRPRSLDPAKPYNELITSDVYFSDEKWQEVLSSHGITIDADKKLLIIQSTGTQQDFIYDLSGEELAKLTAPSLKASSLQERINILNHVITHDFKDAITKDMLNGTEPIAIALKPEVEQSLLLPFEQQPQINLTQNSLPSPPHFAPTSNPEEGYVNGENLEEENARKEWHREGKYGRDVEVGDIWVEKAKPERSQKAIHNQKEANKETDVTYRMSAVINGQIISHEISQKQYDKFMAVDDYQRMRMMSKIFKEVDMKTRPDIRSSFHLGEVLAAGLTTASEVTLLGADIAHHVEHIKNPHPGLGIYHEVHGTGRILVKPGVDSPQDIASRAFEAGLHQGTYGHGIGR